MVKLRIVAAAAAAVITVSAAPALADTFSGTLYYTEFSGLPNVFKITYSYNDATASFALGAATPIASLAGADGIIFDASGHLLVGGQGTNTVYMLDPTTGTVLDTGTLGTNSFHLALDPTGNFVYTSTFGGPLETLPLSGATIGNGTQTNLSGSDTGITQIAYAPDTQKWFYVNGQPNGGGNVGSYDFSTSPNDTTTRIFTGLEPAHGLIYDSYTNLMTMFGAGKTGTFDTSGTVASLKIAPADFTCDFDQGAVDGQGHALVAGCSSITFLDYRVSHDITHPDHVFVVGGFGNIDDVAPLSGLGSGPGDGAVPEPASLILLGTGLAGAAARRYRRRQSAV